ncbi:M23 family metallopeptidase [uncultured Nitratireductor sp.]|uniref:M23 family metallopeptidase n=1 Tax=uncultured Nitratireductor sp. TaxID=520953 RepID=UPI0025DB2D46|nr:M23 family metallopeptidase [uncultured Nitratireductor sp.]
MFFVVIVLIAVCIGVPLIYSWRLLKLDMPSRGAWLIHVADAAVFVALVLLVGRWDMAGYHIRFVLLAVFLGAVLWSFKRHVSRPWGMQGESVHRQHWPTLVSLALFGAALCYVIYGMLPPEEPEELAFPLKDGRFMVGQGGGIDLLNHHATHPEQRYAADITEINGFGYRASGLAPKALDRYVIYGASVVSPCTGEVIGVRNDLPDLIPPDSDKDNPRGNHVIVDCGAFQVELAHLQQGSVQVSTGVSVSAGDSIGKVGNSGNTTEPHLHVHAVDPETNAGVPMSFSGRAPVRNTLYEN